MTNLKGLEIKKDKPLAPLSTFDIGGVAEYFVEVTGSDELEEAITWAKENNIPYKICADASNIVFPDGKLDGLLIRITGGKIKKTDDLELTVDAGANLLETINKANELGLRGLQTLAGIPGSVGGAIVGNAGAYGHSISEVVDKVLVWDEGETKWIENKDCQFDYRESVFKHSPYIVLRAKLKFKDGDPEKLKNKSGEIIQIREEKYKPDLKCPGSFFKNIRAKDVSPEVLERIDQSKIIEGKIPTGYLLEEVDAKGMTQGNIKIADFHGNLFINQGGGTAKDVKKLAKKLKNKAKDKFGIELEEEVRYF